MLRIRDSLGARISNIETKTPAEFEDNFRQYGAQGYSLVFGHGFEFQDAAKRVAPDFPRTVYITTSGNTAAPPNLAGLTFGFAEPSFLAGMLAGGMSRSGRIGVIGGTELPPVRESFVAFAAGVHSVNPTAAVVTSYVGSWDDVSAAREQALAQAARGVDVIFQNADAAGLGVFQAARDCRGVYIIGSNSDQNALAPGVTLGSVVIDLPHAFLLVARQVKDGQFTARVVQLGIRDDVVKLVLNPLMAPKIPLSLKARIDTTAAGMLSGRWKASLTRATS